MDSKVIQIRVEGQLTGVIGMEEVLKNIAEGAGEKADAEIMAELINRIEIQNYIPSKIKEAYGKALLREYKKYLGQAVEEDKTDDLRVIILGPGCFQCTSMESIVRDVMAEMNLPGDLIHVTDAKEIGRYGVMGVPALVINNKVVSIGVVPDKKKIQQWLKDATENCRVT